MEEEAPQPPQQPELPREPFVPPAPPVVAEPTKKPKSKLPFIIIGVACLFLVLTLVAVLAQKPKQSTTQTTTANTTITKTANVQLDPNKDYGNKYANGILPVGDKHVVTDAPKQGYVYACKAYASTLGNAQVSNDVRGPWFVNNNTQYDVNKKAKVLGSVVWQPSLSNTISNGIRTITTNNLPSHVTGSFPIARNDPAYTYDRNPYSIKAQTLAYGLNASPAYGTPNCMGSEVGVMLSGAAIFNAFDASGRDAGAWEIHDSCGGHPQKEGEYHYHTLSSCIKDASVQTVVGFALDGFPITGPVVAKNNVLTTSDLDECHGLYGTITLEGKQITSYHYVMTEDFPYSVSCFRSQPSQPPGIH